MVKGTLVTMEFASGEKILQALDQAGLPIEVAVLLYSPDHEDWWMFLASHSFDSMEEWDALEVLHGRLNDVGSPAALRPPFRILPMKDTFIRTLRRRHRNADPGSRLSGTIGNRFVEDGYILRVT